MVSSKEPRVCKISVKTPVKPISNLKQVKFMQICQFLPAVAQASLVSRVAAIAQPLKERNEVIYLIFKLQRQTVAILIYRWLFCLLHTTWHFPPWQSTSKLQILTLFVSLLYNLPSQQQNCQRQWKITLGSTWTSLTVNLLLFPSFCVHHFHEWKKQTLKRL